MFIAISSRDCSVALKAATQANDERLSNDRSTFEERSYNQLLDGAVHNGMKPTAAHQEEMREMSKRDVDHIMETHPCLEIKEHLELLSKMLDYMLSKTLDYTDDPAVTIDTDDFSLLQTYLPAKVTADA